MAQTKSEAFAQRCSEDSFLNIFRQFPRKTLVTFNKNFTRKDRFHWCSPKKILWGTCKRIPLTDDFAQNATVDPNERMNGRRKQIKQKLNQAETKVQLKDSMKIRASPNCLK